MMVRLLADIFNPTVTGFLGQTRCLDRFMSQSASTCLQSSDPAAIQTVKSAQIPARHATHFECSFSTYHVEHVPSSFNTPQKNIYIESNKLFFQKGPPSRPKPPQPLAQPRLRSRPSKLTVSQGSSALGVSRRGCSVVWCGVVKECF